MGEPKSPDNRDLTPDGQFFHRIKVQNVTQRWTLVDLEVDDTYNVIGSLYNADDRWYQGLVWPQTQMTLKAR